MEGRADRCRRGSNPDCDLRSFTSKAVSPGVSLNLSSNASLGTTGRKTSTRIRDTKTTLDAAAGWIGFWSSQAADVTTVIKTATEAK